mmetsp:Transcript_12941/g.37557  ORF Transcript_12941/g.37557 Transcript_12941/m.37557 type:complete len:82 (+) Transcript_12941:27-272(+)|eukprot:363682-Chlamydomonas_euryale.AAC.12
MDGDGGMLEAGPTPGFASRVGGVARVLFFFVQPEVYLAALHMPMYVDGCVDTRQQRTSASAACVVACACGGKAGRRCMGCP